MTTNLGRPGTAGNRFLAALPRQVSHRLAEQLQPVLLKRGDVIARPGGPLDHLYFPERGFLSLVKIMGDGRTAEVGVVGTEGMVWVAALLGMEHSAFEVIVQLEGSAQRLRTAALRSAMEESPTLKELVLRYMYYAVNQLAQTAACNRLHTLKQRCCRWLLTAHDNARAETFTFTHEFLALMMGVNRPALSLTVGALQRRGLVRYQRASLTILDPAALRAEACECYESLHHELERVYRF